MGISKAVGIPSTVALAGAVGVAAMTGTPWLLIPSFVPVVGCTVAALAHPQINITKPIMSKSSDGKIAWWSSALFLPYLQGNRLYRKYSKKIMKSDEPPFNKVCDDIYVGGWPGEKGENIPECHPAVVDCTVELPRRVPEYLPYMCVPSWDNRAAKPEEIEKAVKWAAQKRAEGYPVFVHCGQGHGRSVTVLCALLVELQIVDNWRTAIKFIKERRTRARLNNQQEKALVEWEELRKNPPRDTEVDLEAGLMAPLLA